MSLIYNNKKAIKAQVGLGVSSYEEKVRASARKDADYTQSIRDSSIEFGPFADFSRKNELRKGPFNIPGQSTRYNQPVDDVTDFEYRMPAKDGIEAPHPIDTQPLITDHNVDELKFKKVAENINTPSKGVESLITEHNIDEIDIEGINKGIVIKKEEDKKQLIADQKDARIKRIQKNLGVKADGIWGKKTQAAFDAVKEFQSSIGVKADGLWGPITEAAYKKSHPGESFNRRAIIGKLATGNTNVDNVNDIADSIDEYNKDIAASKAKRDALEVAYQKKKRGLRKGGIMY